MSEVARAAIPQFEQLMAENPVEPPSGEKNQVSKVGILLQTAKPRASEETIRAWAIRNNLRVLDSGADIGNKILAQIHNGTGPTPIHGRRLVLLMERRQVAQLVSLLNRDVGESAKTAPLAAATASSIDMKLEADGATPAGDISKEQAALMARPESSNPTAPPADEGKGGVGAETGWSRNTKLAYSYAQVAVPIYIVPRQPQPVAKPQP